MVVSCSGRVEIRNNVVVNLIFVVSPTDNGNGIVHTVRRREDPASPWWLRRDKMVLPAKQNGGAI